MSKIIEHNAATGEITERDETTAEKKQRELEATALAENAAAKLAAQAKREIVLAALAAAAGLEPDDVAQALGV